jgi:type III pantothenate kinase
MGRFKRDLVLDIGNTTLGASLFKEGRIAETFHLSSRPVDEKEFLESIQPFDIAKALIGSDNTDGAVSVRKALKKRQIPVYEIDRQIISLSLEVDVPEEVGADRIANCYGALALYPGRNCIIIDMGTAVVFDAVSYDKKFLGGAIYPGAGISAAALHDYTSKLPKVEISKPPSPLSKSTIGNIQSGIYYGLVATIETLAREIKNVCFPNQETVVIATGGLTANVERKVDSFVSAQFRIDLEKDLRKSVDFFEPNLTFIGLYQLLREQSS